MVMRTSYMGQHVFPGYQPWNRLTPGALEGQMPSLTTKVFKICGDQAIPGPRSINYVAYAQTFRFPGRKWARQRYVHKGRRISEAIKADLVVWMQKQLKPGDFGFYLFCLHVSVVRSVWQGPGLETELARHIFDLFHTCSLISSLQMITPHPRCTCIE